MEAAVYWREPIHDHGRWNFAYVSVGRAPDCSCVKTNVSADIRVSPVQVWERGLSSSPHGTSPLNREVEPLTSSARRLQVKWREPLAEKCSNAHVCLTDHPCPLNINCVWVGDVRNGSCEPTIMGPLQLQRRRTDVQIFPNCRLFWCSPTRPGEDRSVSNRSSRWSSGGDPTFWVLITGVMEIAIGVGLTSSVDPAPCITGAGVR